MGRGEHGPRPLELSYQHGTLEFDVAPMGFLHPGSVERQVRLVGVDEEFHPEPEQGRLRYVGLPPGPYELLARARYPHGEYGPVTRFAFSVRPAWWQTWWARLGAVLALVGALALVGRWRQRAGLGKAPTPPCARTTARSSRRSTWRCASG